MTDTLKNLVLVPDVEHHPMDDFLQIAEHFCLRAPDVRPAVPGWNTWRRPRLQRCLLGLWPTLVVGLRAFGTRMRLPGLPVIPWCPWTTSTNVDLTWMRAFVISKSDIGARDQSVKIPRGGLAGFRDRSPQRRNVDPASGEPLMHLRHEDQQAQPFCGRQVAGHPPVANHREARVTLVEDADIEARAPVLAQRAFPEIPVLGINIVRAAADGSVHVCEVNVCGQTWYLSSKRGRVLQPVLGLDPNTQKNTLDTSSGRLITACRSHAR